MSGTWSRKRRSANATVAQTTTAQAAAALTAATSRDALRDQIPLPALLRKEQQLLSRSTDRMFEEAEQSGILCLAGRKLKEFPVTLSHKYDLTDLVSADLSSNRLTELPTSICEQRSLEALRMRSNILRRVPSNITLLDRLTYLDLSNNQLTVIPVSLFDLSIEILLLSGNRLESVPREIRQLSTSLTELDLSHNHIQSLPADLALLKMLRVLNLRKNRLDQFPSELCRLTLHTLDLSCNNFTQLPLHIRKMKSIVILKIGENPLQSPPASIIVKGREHIFKWMDVESGGSSIPASYSRSTYSSSSLRMFGLSRTGLASDDADPLRKSTTAVERRNRNARFNTVGGSDSGYASTADENRLSHELPSSGLDDITEISAFSPSPDEGLGETARIVKKNGSPMDTDSSSGGSTSPVRQMATTTVNSHIIKDHKPVKDIERTANTCAAVAKTSATLHSPIKTAPQSANAEANSCAKPTMNSVLKNVAPTAVPEKSNDETNNNMQQATTEVATEKKTMPIIKRAGPKPISKVAPFVQPVKTANTTHSPPVRPTVKAPAPPTKTPIRQPVRPLAVPKPPPTRATIGTSAVAPKSRSAVPQPKQLGIASTSAAPQKATTPPGGTRRVPLDTRKPLSKSSSVEINSNGTTSIDAMRKALEDRLQITLSKEKEALAAQLSDGVYLCNFANTLRIRSVATVHMPIDKMPLSPPKSRRNLDNFVAACRRMGLPEASISSPADIQNKRNLMQVAKTVLALCKMYPQKSTETKPVIV